MDNRRSTHGKCMIEIDLDTSEFAKFEKVMAELEPKIRKRVLAGAVRSAVTEGRKAIKQATPRGLEPSPASRQYKRAFQNIKVRLKRRGLKRNEVAAQVTSGDAFWLQFYELGTKHQPARPYFAKAFRSAAQAMINRMAEAMRRGIDKQLKARR